MDGDKVSEAVSGFIEAILLAHIVVHAEHVAHIGSFVTTVPCIVPQVASVLAIPIEVYVSLVPEGAFVHIDAKRPAPAAEETRLQCFAKA